MVESDLWLWQTVATWSYLCFLSARQYAIILKLKTTVCFSSLRSLYTFSLPPLSFPQTETINHAHIGCPQLLSEYQSLNEPGEGLLLHYLLL